MSLKLSTCITSYNNKTKLVTFKGNTKCCNKPFSFTAPGDRFDMWVTYNVPIQNSLYMLNDTQRELILTGICEEHYK